MFTQFKSMVNDLETEIERKLKETPQVVKVPEPAVKSNEKPTAPATIKTNVVGESDGSSFSVGKSNKIAAQPSAIVTARKKTRKRKDSMNKDNTLDADSRLAVGRPTSEISTKAPSNLNVVVENANETTATTATASPERPTTPPSKESAFTIFKSEQGRDMNVLFQENKETLNAKKREAKEISGSINKTKAEIDAARSQLDKLVATKEGEETTTTMNGELYLDEDEFELITKLKSLKNRYRAEYEHLQNLRSDFAYIENTVSKCCFLLELSF